MIALRCRARAGFSRRSRENHTMCGFRPCIAGQLNDKEFNSIQFKSSLIDYFMQWFVIAKIKNFVSLKNCRSCSAARRARVQSTKI